MNIKVQRGVAIIPKDETTITVELEKTVNPEKAIVLHGGSTYGTSSYSGASGSGYWDAWLALIDGKHIEAKRAYPSVYAAEVAWQVVEVIPDGEQPEPEKEREIDWTKVPVDTPVLIRNAENNCWEKRYFTFYIPDSEGHKFATWNNGYKSKEQYGITAWKYCKLAPEVDPTPYYKDGE